MSVRQETHSPSESNDRYNTTQADRSFKEIYPGHRVIREDAMDTHQDTHPPDLGLKDKSGDAHPCSKDSDTKDMYGDTHYLKEYDREDISQAIRKTLLVCNTGCMSSLLDDITQNLMAIEDEDTIIMGDIIMSDSSN